jgi:hypothetical protein
MSEKKDSAKAASGGSKNTVDDVFKVSAVAATLRRLSSSLCVRLLQSLHARGIASAKEFSSLDSRA